ncbi:hypothetical protein A1O3_06049 [Capronia epimyces CBS 606.96]|uniref:Aminoglycoside phosphotransferase domain-containing protein n=1 Tax=Capronia epimyces CBS 606.96 TaxID=1182542 RepID=W9XZ35_9EURO|nr:uncharacterized protein A1O3_06049 [Capronia epimyces CBS 606.96]EXJ82236.1 hypothetical protein A1O3_06049 [Capronia epimyces CBS 606.96]
MAETLSSIKRKDLAPAETYCSRDAKVARTKREYIECGRKLSLELQALVWRPRFGPFEATHMFLRRGPEKAPPGFPEVEEMIQLHGLQWGPGVFTHGDLSCLNIPVRGIVSWA